MDGTVGISRRADLSQKHAQTVIPVNSVVSSLRFQRRHRNNDLSAEVVMAATAAAAKPTTISIVRGHWLSLPPSRPLLL